MGEPQPQPRSCPRHAPGAKEQSWACGRSKDKPLKDASHLRGGSSAERTGAPGRAWAARPGRTGRARRGRGRSHGGCAQRGRGRGRGGRRGARGSPPSRAEAGGLAMAAGVLAGRHFRVLSLVCLWRWIGERRPPPEPRRGPRAAADVRDATPGLRAGGTGGAGGAASRIRDGVG